MKPLIYQPPKPLAEEKSRLQDLLNEIQQKREELTTRSRVEMQQVSSLQEEIETQKKEVQALITQLAETKKRIKECQSECPFCHKHELILPHVKEDHYSIPS